MQEGSILSLRNHIQGVDTFSHSPPPPVAAMQYFRYLWKQINGSKDETQESLPHQDSHPPCIFKHGFSCSFVRLKAYEADWFIKENHTVHVPLQLVFKPSWTPTHNLVRVQTTNRTSSFKCLHGTPAFLHTWPHQKGRFPLIPLPAWLPSPAGQTPAPTRKSPLRQPGAGHPADKPTTRCKHTDVATVESDTASHPSSLGFSLRQPFRPDCRSSEPAWYSVPCIHLDLRAQSFLKGSSRRFLVLVVVTFCKVSTDYGGTLPLRETQG